MIQFKKKVKLEKKSEHFAEWFALRQPPVLKNKPYFTKKFHYGDQLETELALVS